MELVLATENTSNSEFDLIKAQLKKLQLQLTQLSITKVSKSDIVEPQKAHHFEAILTNSFTDDSNSVFSELPYQLATASGNIRFVSPGSSTLDFIAGQPYDYFIPPVYGYYRISIVIHGCETFSVPNDPLLIYFIEYETDEHGDDQQTDLSVLLTGIYQHGPDVLEPGVNPSTLNFDLSFVQTYYSECVIRLDPTKKYKLYMTSNAHDSINIQDIGNMELINNLTANIDFDPNQINIHTRQILFVRQNSRLSATYIGPTHPI